MQKNNWQKFILEDFLEFNPKIQLKKGVVARKVDMDKLMPFTRQIIGSQSACFTGGSKFANYDTLVARITPCLENGKTAYVDILENGEVAFGSTEFIVLRAKENISNSLFIYYFAISPKFREKAISLMSGTSGRQRVDVNALKTQSFDFPPLEEQKRIADILGAFDDKIELLQKQNKTLEDMAKAIFKSWFVDFDVVKAKASLVESVPLAGKVRNAEKGVNTPAHQPYSQSIKCLVRHMRQHLTLQEVRLWQHLRKEQLGFKFRRQYPINDKYIADFVCLEKKLIIELDGSQHAGNKQDIIRTEYLQELGFSVLRFWNKEIDDNLTACLEMIRAALNTPQRPTATSPAGGEENGPIVCSPCGENLPFGTKRGILNNSEVTPPNGLAATSPAGGEENGQIACSPCGENLPFGTKRGILNNSEVTPPNGLAATSPTEGEDDGWTKEKIMREYHLTEELYNLFPSSFEDSSLGPIPTVWEVKPLSSIATFLNGLALQKYPAHSDTDFLPVIKIAELRNGISSSSDRADKNLPKEYIVYNGDVLFSWSGSLMVKIWSGKTGALNQHLFKVFSDQYPKWFYYFWINYHMPVFQDIAADKATTMGHIQRKHLDQALVIIPANLDLFTQYFDNLISKQIVNNQQIQTLTELRDSLLPRLISGKIRV